jgi:hypothetical protein
MISDEPQHVLCLLTSCLDFLQITLHDEVLDIRSAYHEPLALLQVDTPNLCLDDPTVSNDTNHMQVLGWLRYAGDGTLIETP